MLTQNFDSDQVFSNSIELFFKKFNVSELINKYFPAKRSGIQPEEIINYLLQLRFSSQTIYSNQNADFLDIPCDDNTVYRFLNNPENDWEGFLRELSLRILQSGDNQDLIANGVFIVDDTDHPRYYSQQLEGISWQFDHTGLCRYRNYLGFKRLTLGLTNFGYYLPNGCVLSASSNHMVNDFLPQPDEKSPGLRRRELSEMKKTDAMFELIKEAQKQGFRATHLLADSWYSEPDTAFKALDNGLEYIGMVKQEGRTRYLFQGKMMSVHEIFDYFQKRWQDYTYQGSVFLDVPVKMISGEREREARLLYFDNVHEAKPYCCFLVTDLNLAALTVQQIYKARFDCEHSYKSIKDTDTIRAGKNCQSLSFDATVAQSCLDLIVYLILQEMDKSSQEKKTAKAGFRQARESICLAKWLNLINGLFKEVLKYLSEQLRKDLSYLTSLVKKFLSEFDPMVREINKLSRFENLNPAFLIENLLNISKL